MKDLELENIPQQLRDLDQWALWKYEAGKDGKQTKVPYQPNGKRASSTNPDTWRTYNQCVGALKQHIASEDWNQEFDGLFFVLSSNDPFSVVDFDHCIDDGKIKTETRLMVDRLKSYTEISPSGEGMHTWVKSPAPGDKHKHTKLQVEFFSDNRFMSVTGWRVHATNAEIEERQEELKQLYDGVFDGANDGANNGQNHQPNARQSPITVEYEPGISFSDEEIIQRACKATNGAKFKLLFLHGDTSGHNYDQSSADMALMDMLAFFTDNDADQMERIFGLSALAGNQPKWFARPDYRQRTIDKALNRPQIKCASEPTAELSNQGIDEPQVIDLNIHTKALDVLQNGDPMKFFLKVFDDFHSGDQIIAEGLLLGTAVQSVRSARGLQSKLTGSSGMGKSSTCKAVFHLHPQKYVLYTSLSDAAAWYHPKIRTGCTIFCDDVKLSDAVRLIIQRATGDWQNVTQRVVMQKVKGEQTPVVQDIPARINWVITSVAVQGGVELLNRQMGYDVQEEGGNYFEWEADRAVKDNIAYNLTEDVEVCREMIRMIKEVDVDKLRCERVDIPYVKDIVWTDFENRRNYNMFLDMIRGFTMLQYMQRERSDVDGNLIATIEDFKHAQTHYTRRGKQQQLHISDSCKRMVSYIENHHGNDRYSGLDQATLQKELNLTQPRISQLWKEAQDNLPWFNVEDVSERCGDADNSTYKRKVAWISKNIFVLDSYAAIVYLKSEGGDKNDGKL
jgi:hypothetical protein